MADSVPDRYGWSGLRRAPRHSLYARVAGRTLLPAEAEGAPRVVVGFGPRAADKADA